MRRRSNLLVLLGIAFFVVGGVIVYLVTSNDDGGGSGNGIAGPATVIVGTDDIPAGSLADDLIEAGKLKAIEVPVEEVTAGAVQSLNQLQGATFIQGFAADQQISSAGLQLQNRTFTVPDGFDAIAVQIDFVPGAAGYVNPGDHINLYGVYKTPTGNQPVPRAELLLTNVEVLDVDLTIPPRRGNTTTVDTTQTAGQRASSTAVTYLLAVRADDAEKVIYTTEFESLYATLTAKDAAPAGPTSGRDGGNILAEEPNVAVNG